MGNCCPSAGGGSRHHSSGGSNSGSSESSYYSVHRDRDRYEPAGGYTRYSRRAARDTLQNAPMPTANARFQGPRPHAHFDTENDYAAERAGLTPIPGARTKRFRDENNVWHDVTPVLYGYAGNPNFDYNTQNQSGNPRRTGQGGTPVGPDAGPIRIIADRHRNLVGVSNHPDGDFQSFERATYHARRSRH